MSLLSRIPPLASSGRRAERQPEAPLNRNFVRQVRVGIAAEYTRRSPLPIEQQPNPRRLNRPSHRREIVGGWRPLPSLEIKPFLATLADGLLAMTGGDLLRLPRVTILLPARPAVRAQREAFLRAAPEGREAGTPLLLPRLQPIGDLDSDELTLADGATHGEMLATPPAIPEPRRRFVPWGFAIGELSLDKANILSRLAIASGDR